MGIAGAPGAPGPAGSAGRPGNRGEAVSTDCNLTSGILRDTFFPPPTSLTFLMIFRAQVVPLDPLELLEPEAPP